jgi:hypothetical protein
MCVVRKGRREGVLAWGCVCEEEVAVAVPCGGWRLVLLERRVVGSERWCLFVGRANERS